VIAGRLKRTREGGAPCAEGCEAPPAPSVIAGSREWPLAIAEPHAFPVIAAARILGG